VRTATALRSSDLDAEKLLLDGLVGNASGAAAVARLSGRADIFFQCGTRGDARILSTVAVHKPVDRSRATARPPRSAAPGGDRAKKQQSALCSDRPGVVFASQ